MIFSQLIKNNTSMDRDIDILMLRKEMGVYPKDELLDDYKHINNNNTISKGILKWSNGGVKMNRTPRIKENEQYTNDPSNIREDNQIFNKKHTRDDINNRMEIRDMFVQTNSNPFLSTNNYIEDINVRDNFLRSQDSNINNPKPKYN